MKEEERRLISLGERAGVRAIGPGEDVREAPGSHLGFGFFAGGRRHYCGREGVMRNDWLLMLSAEIVGQFLHRALKPDLCPTSVVVK